MRIELISIELACFKSFIAPQLITFEADKGLNFLGGLNKVHPRMGANGAGKSSLWDAMFWCFYGYSIRGDRASDLTARSAKRPAVETKISIDGASHAVKRIGNPERLTIDAMPATQEEVDRLLRLSRAQFSQSVLFGQSASFFLDLTIYQRSALLEETLDLSVWQRASDFASKEAESFRALIAISQRKLAYEAGRAASLPNRAELEKAIIEEERSRTAKFDESLATLVKLEAKLADVNHAFTSATAIHEKLKSAKHLEAALNQAEIICDKAGKELAGAQAVIAVRKNEINALGIEATGKCPTCFQQLDQTIAKARAHDLECANIDMGLELAELSDKVRNSDAAYKRARSLHQAHQDAANEAASKLYAYKASVQIASNDVALQTVKIESQIEEGEKPTESQIILQQHDAMLANIQAAYAAAKQDITANNELLELAIYWKQAFKKVRLFVIARLMVQLEVETANAASLLGLEGWDIQFVIESENKSGGLKQGVQVLVSNADGKAAASLWSGGENQRIRLAVEMGLSSLIQRLSGAQYGFEIWDEPSSYLSDEGVEDLLDCLRYKAMAEQKAIWLTEHRTPAYNFTNVWTVIKDASGSQVIKEKVVN